MFPNSQEGYDEIPGGFLLKVEKNLISSAIERKGNRSVVSIFSYSSSLERNILRNIILLRTAENKSWGNL